MTCNEIGLTGHLLHKCNTDSRYREVLFAQAVARGQIPASAMPRTPLQVIRTTVAAKERRAAQCNNCDHWKPCDVCGVGNVRRCQHPEQPGMVNEKLIDLQAQKCPMGKWSIFPIRHDSKSIAPNQDKYRFNSSIIRWGDGYALAYRDGWAGSEVHIATLDADFKWTGYAKRLWLRHSQANFGREDPRLFMYGGALHVMFIGVVGGRTLKHTNVLYARLSNDFEVQDTFAPELPNRQHWEKNWAFFQAEDLFAVYSIAPHRVIRVRGNVAEWAYETPTRASWSGGALRGGASPVLSDGEFWHFFHGRAMHQGANAYNIGLCTFEAKPPFRITRMTPEPILWADHASKPPDQYVSCIFPCGAVRNGDEWVVSSGEHDRWTRLDLFTHSELTKRLVNV